MKLTYLQQYDYVMHHTNKLKDNHMDTVTLNEVIFEDQEYSIQPLIFNPSDITFVEKIEPEEILRHLAAESEQTGTLGFDFDDATPTPLPQNIKEQIEGNVCFVHLLSKETRTPCSHALIKDFMTLVKNTNLIVMSQETSGLTTSYPDLILAINPKQIQSITPDPDEPNKEQAVITFKNKRTLKIKHKAHNLKMILDLEDEDDNTPSHNSDSPLDFTL